VTCGDQTTSTEEVGQQTIKPRRAEPLGCTNTKGTHSMRNTGAEMRIEASDVRRILPHQPRRRIMSTIPEKKRSLGWFLGFSVGGPASMWCFRRSRISTRRGSPAGSGEVLTTGSRKGRGREVPFDPTGGAPLSNDQPGRPLGTPPGPSLTPPPPASRAGQGRESSGSG